MLGGTRGGQPTVETPMRRLVATGTIGHTQGQSSLRGRVICRHDGTAGRTAHPYPARHPAVAGFDS